MDRPIEEILRCPVTRSSLEPLDRKALERLNDKIDREELWHADGSPVRHRLDAALRTPDGTCHYGVREGIHLLLPSLAMVDSRDRLAEHRQDVRDAKRIVMDFYDSFGWQTDGSDQYEDAVKFEDLRPVSRDYVRRCHERLRRYFPESGDYFLDVASGPVQYPDYLPYSAGYRRRICGDLSFTALREARRKLGDHGVYLLCDITNLPLADGAVDGLVSLHTIYHVPADEQASAVDELVRVLDEKGSGAVVYSWGGHSALMKLAMLQFIPAPLKRWIKKALGRDGVAAGAGDPELYFHAHDYRWYREHLQARLGTTLACWRSVSVPFMQRYVRPWLLGRQLLGALYHLESWFPRFFGRFGQYPVFVLRKGVRVRARSTRATPAPSTEREEPAHALRR